MSKEIRIEKKKDLRDQIIAQNNETINGVERIKPLTDLDEYEQYSDNAPVFTETPLKKYQRDTKEKEFKEMYSDSVLSKEQEEEIKEKFIQKKTDEIMKNIEDLSKDYVPQENIDPEKEVDDIAMMRIVSKLFNIPFKTLKERHEEYKKAESDFEERLKNYDPNDLNELCKCPEYKEVKTKTFDDICKDIMDLHERKNADYGDAAYKTYKKYGIRSYLARINDKLSRLDELTEPGAQARVKDETILDSFMDMAAYSIMAIEALLKG